MTVMLLLTLMATAPGRSATPADPFDFTFRRASFDFEPSSRNFVFTPSLSPSFAEPSHTPRTHSSVTMAAVPAVAPVAGMNNLLIQPALLQPPPATLTQRQLIAIYDPTVPTKVQSRVLSVFREEAKFGHLDSTHSVLAGIRPEHNRTQADVDQYTTYLASLIRAGEQPFKSPGGDLTDYLTPVNGNGTYISEFGAASTVGAAAAGAFNQANAGGPPRQWYHDLTGVAVVLDGVAVTAAQATPAFWNQCLAKQISLDRHVYDLVVSTVTPWWRNKIQAEVTKNNGRMAINCIFRYLSDNSDQYATQIVDIMDATKNKSLLVLSASDPTPVISLMEESYRLLSGTQQGRNNSYNLNWFTTNIVNTLRLSPEMRSITLSLIPTSQKL